MAVTVTSWPCSSTPIPPCTWGTNKSLPSLFLLLEPVRLFSCSSSPWPTIWSFCFLGWEGVGFCSFALIGFWHDKLGNVDAGRKAFLMTRVGDLGFVAALALLVGQSGQASLTELAATVPNLSTGLAAAIGFCFLFAALGKSAQLRCPPGCPMPWPVRRRFRP